LQIDDVFTADGFSIVDSRRMPANFHFLIFNFQSFLFICSWLGLGSSQNPAGQVF